MAYEHNSTDIKEAWHTIRINNKIGRNQETIQQDLNAGIDVLNNYINKYDTLHGFTSVYTDVLMTYLYELPINIFNYESYQGDDRQLNLALKAIQKSSEVLQMFDYNFWSIEFQGSFDKLIDFKTHVLLKLNRENEALESLHYWLNRKDLPGSIQDKIRISIIKIKNEITKSSK